jgi:hypothetical protein
MSSNQNDKVLLLNSKNFTAWKQVMIVHLDYKGCLDMLTVDPVGEEQSRREKLALYILKSAIDPVELVKTGNCLTAKELWTKLTENFEGSKATQQGSVSAEWAAFGLRPNEDLFTYCGRFEQILSKLEMVEYKVPEDQKFYFFLRGLPEARREFCFTWRLCHPTGKIGDLVSAVKIRFHTDNMMKDRDSSVALLADSSSSSAPSQKKPSRPPSKKSTANDDKEQKDKMASKVCYHCHKPGHTWNRCLKLKASFTKQQDKKPSAEPSKDNLAKELVLMASDRSATFNADLWVADSGATAHITPMRRLLRNFVEFESPREIVTGGSSRFAVGHGEYAFSHGGTAGRLTYVLLVPVGKE